MMILLAAIAFAAFALVMLAYANPEAWRTYPPCAVCPSGYVDKPNMHNLCKDCRKAYHRDLVHGGFIMQAYYTEGAEGWWRDNSRLGQRA